MCLEPRVSQGFDSFGLRTNRRFGVYRVRPEPENVESETVESQRGVLGEGAVGVSMNETFPPVHCPPKGS